MVTLYQHANVLNGDHAGAFINPMAREDHGSFAYI